MVNAAGLGGAVYLPDAIPGERYPEIPRSSLATRPRTNSALSGHSRRSITPSASAAMASSAGPSGGLLLDEAKLANHLLTHDEFLHLAGNGHRERIDEAYIARNLVMRDLPVAEIAD